jgi:hypothetical protein
MVEKLKIMILFNRININIDGIEKLILKNKKQFSNN